MGVVIHSQREQIKNAHDLHEKLNFDFAQSRGREEELSKKLQLLQSRYNEILDERGTIQGDLSDS
jgi:hypothetical protein